MISNFRCCVTDQRLMILDYDCSRNHGKYRALVNESQVAVLKLHLQNVGRTPVSQLSLLSLKAFNWFWFVDKTELGCGIFDASIKSLSPRTARKVICNFISV